MKKLIAALVAISATPLAYACNNSSGDDPGTGGGGGDGTNLPCDVETVLKDKCQSCHAASPLFGAPMPLMTYADTQVVADGGLRMWRRMQDKIADGTMPQGSKLTNEQKATLNGWFERGALGSSKSCTGGNGGSSGSAGSSGSGGSSGSAGTAGTGGKGGTGGTAGTAGKGGTGGTAGTAGKGGTGGTAGKGGAGGTAGTAGTGGTGGSISTCNGNDCVPCEVKYRFNAHAFGGTAKYSVPNPTSDKYVCFTFKTPFAKGELATAMQNIIDDTRVIHHWILYGVQSGTDGAVSTSNCEFTTLNGTHVAGWAPGGGSTVLPDDVGLNLDYPFFTLQVHYNNKLYADGADASGVGFCSTTTGRPNVAGIAVLGNVSFSIPNNANDYPVTGTCNPANLSSDGKPITLIGTSPHMHKLGVGFTTTHTRGGVDQGILSNVPIGDWSFDAQYHYPVTPRRQLLAGDVLKTTCYYDNSTGSPVGFGSKTSQEMCYDFITIYPYEPLKNRCGPPF